MTTSLITLQPFTEIIAAGERAVIHHYARMLTILANTASETIYVGIGEMEPVPLKAGLQYELEQGDNFDRIVLLNNDASSTTVSIILSNGIVRDNRLTITGSVFSDLLEASRPADTIETPAPVTAPASPTAAISIAADADQREIEIQNNGSYDVYVGDSAVAAATGRGIKITPGSSRILSTNAAVYLQAVAAGSSAVSYLRYKRA